MFQKLVASEGGRSAGWRPSATLVSVGVHALLIAGAAYLSLQPSEAAEEPVELVTYVELPEAVEEVESAPEIPAAPAEPLAATPPPQGFQELLPPQEIPLDIPEVNLGQPAVRMEDFSGVGEIGGIAQGVQGGTPQRVDTPMDSSDFVYEVAVLDSKPELRNGALVQALMARLYPRLLRDAGVGGQVVMQFVVRADGSVERGSARVVQATHPPFAEVSVEVVERFKFRPGKYKGQPVRVLVRLPITWRPQV